jgi:hypothetical protein
MPVHADEAARDVATARAAVDIVSAPSADSGMMRQKSKTSTGIVMRPRPLGSLERARAIVS